MAFYSVKISERTGVESIKLQLYGLVRNTVLEYGSSSEDSTLSGSAAWSCLETFAVKLTGIFSEPQNRHLVPDHHTFFVYGEAGSVMHACEIISNLEVSLGSPAAVFQNGGQYGRKIVFFHFPILIFRKAWLVICLFRGFCGQGFQIYQYWQDPKNTISFLNE